MSRARLLLTLAAVLALSVLVLRPLCVAGHPQMHEDGSAACCTTIGGAASATGADTFIAASAQPPFTPSAALSFLYLLATSLFLGAAVRVASSPPRLLPFYARSSRILR
jgi:hypothetical protein